MPELTEQMYCSEQIFIPPSFPYLLRQFAKAAIRSQPTDLLKWSTAYFRCLSLNIPPPIKPRLEYPIPRDHCGVTPGWLKALLYQLQNNQTVSFKILWDRWTGSCLEHNTLIQILCLGGFDDPGAIPWLRFIGLCAAHLTDDLTHTMILICEIMTEEPEGGSAMITLETFTDLYRFLANIDASHPQVLKNLYFTDSLLSLWRETIEKDEGPKEAKEEVISEEESEKTQVSEESEEKEIKVADSKEIISCPSIPADDDYSMDYYVDIKEMEDEGEQEHEQEQSPEEEIGDQTEQEAVWKKESDLSAAKGSDELDKEEGADEGDAEKASDEGDKTSAKGAEEGEAPAEGEAPTEEMLAGMEGDILEPAPYESVDTIQEEPRRIEPETAEQRMLREDLERLKSLQQELPGEADDEVEKFKCQLIAEVPLTKSQEDAIVHFTVQEGEKGSEEGESEEGMGMVTEEDGGKVYEDIFVDAIPGIGPPVSVQLVNAVCEYMKNVSSIQHGMVMPRNIRHYNCPPLEVLEY